MKQGVLTKVDYSRVRHKRQRSLTLGLVVVLLYASCSSVLPKLHPVTYKQFEAFVNATNYVTDAEKYGWSIVQLNVFDFITVESATWKKPDGNIAVVDGDLPVTQVSYNDAISYCSWAKARLPSYDEYWDLVKSDKRNIVSDNLLPISKVKEVNIIGNVWDITTTGIGENIRLAGGSLFCSEKSCHGTVKERELFVDKTTGNIHIGFSVIK